MNLPFRYSHVEDYMEIIAGLREPNGKSTGIFNNSTPPISLARYDMKIVPSLATQTYHNAQGYTDRQAALAAQLVLKYERQLTKLGIDVSPVRDPQYRTPIRVVDRSTRVWIEDDRIMMRFPYMTDMVETVRKASQTSQGSFFFNKERRHHEAALTEWNLNWIYGFAHAHEFEIDPNVRSLMDLILTTEKSGYQIELTYADQGLSITNAANSLIEYINTHVGGFGFDNLLRLCDYAPLLGYNIHRDIQQDISRTLGPRFLSLCSNRNLKADDRNELAQQILDYACRVDRFPIYIYEPDLTERLLTIFGNLVEDHQVCLLKDNTKVPEITANTRIVYTNKLPKRYYTDRIPLMISSAGMMFGGDREMWLQASEKVVYFSHEVYNKNIQGSQVCKLD